MIMICSLSNVHTDFHKGLPSVSISNGLFSLVLKHDLQNFVKVKRNVFGHNIIA